MVRQPGSHSGWIRLVDWGEEQGDSLEGSPQKAVSKRRGNLSPA